MRFSLREPGSTSDSSHFEFRIRMKPHGSGRFDVFINKRQEPLAVQHDQQETRDALVDLILSIVEERVR